MTQSSVVSAARRILPALTIAATVAILVPLLARMGVPMTSAGGGKNYGTFVIGVAAVLLLTRVLDFLFFEILFRLRRGGAAPELLRQLVSLLVFGLCLGLLFKIVLSANLAALLTTSAIITAVVGLALQETLGNLFSGLALALERTVRVGDMVRAGNTIGLVEQLSWRAIKVRTMEGNAVLIPNGLASRERLEVFHRGGLPMARVLRILLEYHTPPARARSALETALSDLPGVASRPAPAAGIAAFDHSGITYELRYWLEDYARYLEMDAKALERVWYQLDRERIPFALPIIRQHQYAAGPLARPDDADAVAASIERSELFAPLSPAERRRLASGARRRRYTDGETIVHQGDTTSSMFLIAGGLVAISIHGDGAESRKLALLRPGSAFGEISLLTGEPRLATARAAAEAELVEIDKETLAPILEANPSLVEQLDAIIGERRRKAADRLEETAAPAGGEPESLRARIARFFGLKGLD